MIGVGIITCNRKSLFEVCINSIPKVDYLVIVNDGKPYEKEIYTSKPDLIIEHKVNKGIASSKNQVIKILVEKHCEHIFLVEDDISIKREDVFNHYIKTAEDSGIYHLNFAFHGDGNRDEDGTPISRKLIYGDGIEKLSLNKNLLGAFSYYHKSIFDKFGLIDERYKNGLEHVDHTYQIIKSGFHPPFWWFADAPESYKYIQDQDIDHSKSVIRKNRILWRLRMFQNKKLFKNNHGLSVSDIPDSSEEIVLNELRRIQNLYSGHKILSVR
jgi:GT2 family glycosyltransferase